MSGSLGLVGKTLRRFSESAEARVLRESNEQHELLHPGERVQHIENCDPGGEVTVAGEVANLTVRPEGSAPALEVELQDATGRVFVVWLGRRRIPGIYIGRHIVIHGRLNCVMEHPTIYNPRYELLPD
jgi:RecG-like helicase